MVDFILKHRLEIISLLVLAVGYFLLRAPNLTLQPIFADEAIYIRWAQVIRAEPTLRFLPLSDGKTPLFMWSMVPFLKLISDPLLAGRLLSVFSGFFTLLGVFFVARKVFNARTAFWAGLLYVITPFTVFFDRMALVDSMLSAFTVWTIYFAIWLINSLRGDIAMILGYLLGAAVLTKTPGMLNFFILPISILGFRRDGRKHALIKIVLLWMAAILIGLLMYNLLRLGPNFHMLSSRNADYLFSPLELVGRPLDPFIPHFRDILDWFPKLLTWPILLAIIWGSLNVVFGLWRQSFRGPLRLGVMILIWAFIPLLLNMAFLKTFTARYLLSSIPLLLIIAGFGVTKLLPPLSYIKKIPLALMLIVLLPLPLIFNYYLITSPSKAALPREERIGYFEEWTAGYGFADIAAYLLEKSKDNKVVVGTEGFFGTLPDGLQIYLDKSNISIIGSSATISPEIRNAAKDNLTFFVGNKKNLHNKIRDIILIKEYPKFQNLDDLTQDATVLYQVLP